MKVQMPFYVVNVGHSPGIYKTWDEAFKQVSGYSGAIHCKVETMEAAYKLMPGARPFEPQPKPKPQPEPQPEPKPEPEPEPIVKIKPVFKVKPKIIVRPKPKGPVWTGMEKRYYEHKDYTEDLPIHVYTDGSTFNNGQKNAHGGYGVFFACPIPNLSSRLTSGKVTNNVAELQAIYNAMLVIRKQGLQDVIIHYDSEYAAGVTTGRKQAYTNLALVSECKDLYKEVNHAVKFKHVYSHTNYNDLHSIGNEIADELAKGLKKI
jgi:ribonuclease HI